MDEFIEEITNLFRNLKIEVPKKKRPASTEASERPWKKLKLVMEDHPANLKSVKQRKTAELRKRLQQIFKKKSNRKSMSYNEILQLMTNRESQKRRYFKSTIKEFLKDSIKEGSLKKIKSRYVMV